MTHIDGLDRNGTLRRCARWAAFAFVALWAIVGASDTISVDGTTYENVYIRESSRLYYIQFPETGKVMSVRKTAVDRKEVQISKDRTQRAKLLKQWKASRGEKPEKPKRTAPSKTHPAQPPVGTIIPKPEAPEQTLRPVSNIPPGSKEERPLFVNREGIVTFTNRPERYRARSEYIEVTLSFDRVVVPKQYRAASNRPHAERERPYDAGAVKDLATYYAGVYGIDANLVLAVIRQESNFVARAQSRAGACGLMQLMPGTAAEMGVEDIFDPAQNIGGGTQYLAKMLSLFNGDLDLALAGYNAGPGNVKKHGGVPPFRETREYVRAVKAFYEDYSGGHATVAYVPGPQSVPLEESAAKAPYILRFKNGWTQPADEVGESGEYYFVTVDGRTSQIRKSYVAAIDKTSAE